MEQLKKIWNYFNGNKTVIGLFVITLLQQEFLTQLLPKETLIWQALYWLGGVLAGTGVLHKLVKSNTDVGSNV